MVLEYAFGNNPNVPLLTNQPSCVIVATNGQEYGALGSIHAVGATDL